MPLEWYKPEEHIGYDQEGNRLIKKGQKDTLDRMLARNDSTKVSGLGWWCCQGGWDIGVAQWFLSRIAFTLVSRTSCLGVYTCILFTPTNTWQNIHFKSTT